MLLLLLLLLRLLRLLFGLRQFLNRLILLALRGLAGLLLLQSLLGLSHVLAGLLRALRRFGNRVFQRLGRVFGDLLRGLLALRQFVRPLSAVRASGCWFGFLARC